MIEQFIQQLNVMFLYLPGGIIVPLIGAGIGFIFGATKYIRSFKYWHCYYIEHGEVLCFMDNNTSRMADVSKKHKLDNSFRPVGYVSGLTWTFLKTILGWLIGSVWPLAVVVGIFTIPNFIIRYVAKDRRNKAVFEQTLKGEAK